MSSQHRTAAVPTLFSCTERTWGRHATWLCLSGELDCASSPSLAATLDDALAQRLLVVLDLSALEFIDTSGIHVIEEASVGALLRGRRVVLTRVPPSTLRLIAHTGTETTIEVLDLPDELLSEPLRLA